MKIHKQKWERKLIAQEVLCGRWIQREYVSRNWKNVTCENCLRKRR